ncbi:MAG: GntR family transcriptional regulator [Candidatus Eremiobacteraeota bacterium]|nr:GntR family transcriptional regulator [Candidatus Eremiobacteraeota bacterium]
MPPAFFSVDPHGGAPLYQQLAEQIKRAIAVGALSPGERLPTVKGLAIDLKLNANTVARVYRELEREGVIATAPGRGSFVSENGALGDARRVALDVANRGVDEAVREARSLGITHPEVRTIADASIARWYPEETK